MSDSSESRCVTTVFVGAARFSLAAALVGWSFVSPRLPTAWRVTLQAGVGGLLVLVTRAPLGLRPPRLWAGLRLGSAAGVVAASAIAATTAVPPVRAAMADREPPASVPGWLLLRIPVGTVWAEEAAFRAALATAGFRCVRQSRRKVAAGRKLSGSPTSRTRGRRASRWWPPYWSPVSAGWLFGWLADRSGSLAAPMLVHLAINEAGAMPR